MKSDKSATEAARPLVKSINSAYSKTLLEYNSFDIIGTVGTLHQVRGFDCYNHLLSINSIFSSQPRFDVVDRTQMAQGPIRFAEPRPWSLPKTSVSLEQAMQNRVLDICARQQPVNIFWSGGVDSTAIVVAFLRYCPDLSQCRILYSPWSTYEHPDFFKMLHSRSDLDLVDISGDWYLENTLNGVYISGNSSDEIHGSLDHSFYEKYGTKIFTQSWQDFFRQHGATDRQIEFCQQHSAQSGRPIDTVLEFRWWFYAVCKITGILHSDTLALLTAGHCLFDPARLIGFFDCEKYEQFIYYNLDKLAKPDNYASWRQFLKDFCFEFDGFDVWRQNKKKFHSGQIGIYTVKKQILLDHRNLMLMSDGSVIKTPNLPFLSQQDYQLIHPTIQHIWRHSDQL